MRDVWETLKTAGKLTLGLFRMLEVWLFIGALVLIFLIVKFFGAGEAR
jgi:hypothetical protein